MSLLKKLFGTGDAKAPEAEPTEYKGFQITPRPAREGSQFRIGALIEKDGKSHHLIRADLLQDIATASDASIGKARQMIDEQGDRIFG